MKKSLETTIAAALMLGTSVFAASAGPLMDRIEAGEPIRIGFANELPFAYPGSNGEPLGFVNAHTLGVLDKMGYTNIEPVQTDWGGLIPGLQAGRFDIITGGMNILAARCENVAFSEPMARIGDGFLVPAGNPKGLDNYEDIKEQGAVMVTGAGYSNIQAARDAGVEDGNIMQVPGPTEILAAVRAERADAGAGTYFTMKQLADSAGGELDVSDPNAMPEDSFNWAGIGFSKEDQDFVDAFNEAQAEYLGSEEMLAAVSEYGYSEATLPGDVTTEWVCANR
ncbi:ectoine/hydroxyectoine ABC transporter substrate-binding protein EhuB [Silicimonas algicola]|uniref:Amino acid ABC transporter substrate-binding protein (PAAT family) n=1 Tax=Silicimonas algicola TaxID=1826607 RepID=A0A316G4N6_9RHOB|nr:ectoine/hydroxyectoine ABC transporter substrate-binding protein EhuB [Silicimonas algicola]AZQ68440.1 ectoine/hydroxyectoine ABC transporter substrate-binding protein EhuB [Silicimonas algicola]PWK55859.1 amino acid ABC transporter substrate-binding protein (PAAT family) [Silicimonas algicola]